MDAVGNHVSGLDDAVIVNAEQGTFYLADTGNNQVLTIRVEDLSEGSLFASVGSLNVLGKVDWKTGRVSPFVTGVSAPHGLVFVPMDGGDDNQQGNEGENDRY